MYRQTKLNLISNFTNELIVMAREEKIIRKPSLFYKRFQNYYTERDETWLGGTSVENGVLVPCISTDIGDNHHWCIGQHGKMMDRYIDWKKKDKKFKLTRNWELTLKSYLEGNWMFTEYCQHHLDPEIGNINLSTTTKHVKCGLAHEMAHAINWWNHYNGDPGVGTSHGIEWQRIYRFFRRELGFVTPWR